MAQKIQHDVEHISFKKVEAVLSELEEGTREINEANKKEVARRAEAEREYAAVCILLIVPLWLKHSALNSYIMATCVGATSGRCRHSD